MDVPDAVRTLEQDLRAMFGGRLQSLVAYRETANDTQAVRTLAVFDALTADDLRACAGRTASWHDAGVATPLLLAAQEFGRSLDAFPLEFGAILADHVVVCGVNPFQGLRVDPAHLRHACEIQARSHLLHLREGYLETRGRGDALADLIARSSAPFIALITSVARLLGADTRDAKAAGEAVERVAGLAPGSVTAVVALGGRESPSSEHARLIFPTYLDTVERLTRYVDHWT
jgi:hypothetical protein